MSHILIFAIEISKYFTLLGILWLAANSIYTIQLGSVVWMVSLFYLVITLLTNTSGLGAELTVKPARRFTLGSGLLVFTVGSLTISLVFYYILNRFRDLFSLSSVDDLAFISVLMILPITLIRFSGSMINGLATTWVNRLLNMTTVALIAYPTFWLFLRDELTAQGLISAIVVGSSASAGFMFIISWLISGWSIRYDVSVIGVIIRHHLSSTATRAGWFAFDILGILAVCFLITVEVVPIYALALILIVPVRFLAILLVNIKLVDRSPAALFKDRIKGVGIIRFSLVATILLALFIAVSTYAFIHYLWPESYRPAFVILLIMLPGAVTLGLCHTFYRAYPDSLEKSYISGVIWISICVQLLGVILLVPKLGVIGLGLSYSIAAIILGLSLLHRTMKYLAMDFSSLLKFERDDLIDYIY